MNNFADLHVWIRKNEVHDFTPLSEWWTSVGEMQHLARTFHLAEKDNNVSRDIRPNPMISQPSGGAYQRKLDNRFF